MYEITRQNVEGVELERYGIVSSEAMAKKIAKLLNAEDELKIDPPYSIQYGYRPLVSMTDEMAEQIVQRLESSIRHLETENQ